MIKVIKAAILKLSGNRQFCWGILSKVIKIIKMIKIASHFLNLRGRLNTKRRRREVGDGGTTGDSPPEPRGFAGECLDEPKGINQITVAILLVAMATHVFSFQRPLRNFGRRPIILGVGNVRRDMVGDNDARLWPRAGLATKRPRGGVPMCRDKLRSRWKTADCADGRGYGRGEAACQEEGARCAVLI